MTIALCVDLDGTLIRIDSTFVAWRQLIKKNPLVLLQSVVWLMKGRAYLKQQIAVSATLDVTQLPYHQALLHYIREQKSKGREIALITAADQSIAKRVAEHLQLFDAVLASDGRCNLKSKAKRDALDQRYGKKQYIYAGNERADYAVWAHAKAAIVVNAPASVLAHCKKIAPIERIFN